MVPDRTGTVVDFLAVLDDVENELTAPDHDYVEDPALAKAGELIPGGYKVVRRIGQGACSIVLLVEREGKEYVLKVASDPQHNGRLKDEADVLQKLRHPHIIEFVDTVEVGDRFGFLMWPVFADKDKKIIETLGKRRRKEGRPAHRPLATLRRRPAGRGQPPGRTRHPAPRHQARQHRGRHGGPGRQAACRAVRLLALPHAGRQHPRRDHRLHRPPACRCASRRDGTCTPNAMPPP